MLFVQHPGRGVEVDLPVSSQRADVDLESGQLPRHDIAVMLQRRQQDAVAPAAWQGLRHQIDRLGRAAGEDHLMLLTAY